MELAEKLVFLRKETKVSQLKLAELMGVSRQAVSRWETGIAVPTIENLKYLSNLYNVTLDYLLLDDDKGKLDLKNSTVEETGDKSKLNPIEEKKQKKHTAVRWVCISCLLFMLIVVICICVSIKNNENFIPINNMPKEEVETEDGMGFDLEW